MEIAFSHPQYLVALFAIPFIIFFHFISLKARRARALQFANFEAIARVRGIDLYSKNLFTPLFLILAFVFIIGAMAGPQVVREGEISKFATVIALDVSQSMEAKDILPNRLEAAKDSAIDFVNGLPEGSRIGVIAFSGNSFIKSDVTDNKQEVLQALEEISLSPIGGTDSYEAVITSTNLLIREPYRAIVVLSDGQSNVGNLEDAIDYAVENEVVIYTLGIGTESGGETGYGFSKMDEDSLKALAYNTRGEYFRVDNASALTESFNTIEMKKEGTIVKDETRLFLIIALIFLVIEYTVSTSLYRMFV